MTNCPVGHVTTEIITSITTWCPGEQTPTNVPPHPTSLPGGELPGSQCPGPNCAKPTGKPTGAQPGGMSTTVKPCPTCGSGNNKPASSGLPVVPTTSVPSVPTTGAATEMFRISGLAAVAAVVAVFVL